MRLVYAERETRVIPQWYAWIDRKTFRAPGPLTAADAVDALLAHPGYLDHYATPENASAGSVAHGPYSAELIVPGDFLPSSPDEFAAVLDMWLSWLGPFDGPAAPFVDDLVAWSHGLVGAAEHVLMLRDLRLEAEHEWGKVFTSFEEFVLVHADGTVDVLVMGED